MKAIRKATLALLLTLSQAALGQYPGAKAVPAQWKRGFDSMKVVDAKEILNFLAGPNCQGRGPRQPGFGVAAGFCASWLQRNGVKPAGDNGSYFQHFYFDKVSTAPATVSFGTQSGGFKLALGTDFDVTLYRHTSLPIKFAFIRLTKYPIPETWDLTAVKDRVVIFAPDSRTINRDAFMKLQSAFAGTMQVVTATNSAEPFVPRIATIVRDSEADKPGIVNFRITYAAAKTMASFLGASGFGSGDGAVFETPEATLTLKGDAKRELDHETMNVLMKIEGSDPILKQEAVVVGAHLDHMGTSSRGTFWGADDNGSGSTAAMLIARALTQNPIKPKRTVIVGLWSHEESGLLGSQFYAAHPIFPMDKTVAYINMDMVGRNCNYKPWGELAENNADAVFCGSAKLWSPDLYQLMHDANRFVNLTLRDDKEDRTMRSDTGSFAKHGVPILKAFTGEHEDYHKVTDTLEKINWLKLENISKWLYLGTQQLAAQSARPNFERGATYLMGRVTYTETILLNPGAVVEVSLVDVSRADAPAILLDKTVITKVGQIPIMWALKYRPDKLVNGASYAVQAKITANGKLIFANTTSIPVLKEGQPTAGIEIRVEPTSPSQPKTTIQR